MDTNICNEILEQSTAVRPPMLDEVYQKIKDIPADFDSVTKYKTNIVSWLKPMIDLSDFSVYPMNGITEGLNWWYYKDTRSVYMEPGEYQWLQPRGNHYDDSIKYLSVPSAIDGNFIDIPKHVATAVDLAYVGSTRIEKIELPANTEVVFYSLSKPFGVRNIRTGWIFTRKPDPRQEALIGSTKYYNYFANAVAEKIISEFDIDYIWNKLATKQSEICNKYNFTPSDSVWLATTRDSAYNKFSRNGVNRLCLAPCY